MRESACIMRELTNRHLQSVVSLKVQWKEYFLEGMQPISCASGSIVHSSRDFIYILTCSHTFKSYTVCEGPGFDSVEIINNNTNLQVDFIDGYVAAGLIVCIDWWKDLCLVGVPFPVKSCYAPVQFIDDEVDKNGQSIYKRGGKVYSIFCFPVNQKDNNLLFGTTVKGEICGRNDLIGDDLDPVYRSDLRFFEVDMAGAGGCSGAPIFSKDLLVMGMRICKAGDLGFALKFNQIREWAYTWFNIKKASSMKEVVGRASNGMSRELMELQCPNVDSLLIEYDINTQDQ